MKYIYKLSVLSLLITLMACNESENNNDDKVQTKDITKDGAIETIVSTIHLNDSTDLLTTSHKIWKDNVMVKETIHSDTLPALGTMNSNVKDEQGNEKNVTLKKDYEFYITVK